MSIISSFSSLMPYWIRGVLLLESRPLIALHLAQRLIQSMEKVWCICDYSGMALCTGMFLFGPSMISPENPCSVTVPFM